MQNKTAQDEFDETYITSSEICRRLNLSRSAVMFRRQNGLLPDSIFANGSRLVLWKRSTIEPFLAAWDAARRAHAK